MSNQESISRRKFLVGTSILLAGTALKLKGEGLSFLSDEPIIDIHQHTDFNGRSQEDLLTHQRTMGITTTILLPAGRPLRYGSTYYGVGNGLQAKAGGNELCREFAAKYPKEFIAGVNEVPDYPGAPEEIEKYLKLGAPVIGELKFGLDCDSQAMQKIYQIAQDYDVPVIMHWQYNMYNRGFERFYKMLKKYHKVKFIGHAQTWWANIDKNHKDQNVLYPKGKVVPGGLTDRLLSDYENVYGDISGFSGLYALTRDEEQTKEFLKRHQDKLLYGSDCSDSVGRGEKCTGAQAIEAVRKLSASKEIERKILFNNARKLFRLNID